MSDFLDYINVKNPEEARKMHCFMALANGHTDIMCKAGDCMGWRSVTKIISLYIDDDNAHEIYKQLLALGALGEKIDFGATPPPRQEDILADFIFCPPSEEDLKNGKKSGWKESAENIEKRQKKVAGWCGLAGSPKGLE
jgi:hypothetical protein